ncbi:uncharacterized protein LODBEIA_P54830 [Lodderomyces beijingensis]|uniref:rRNA-processing protein EFG1 n=1 Tax=Lodderomyces beijingensis TaxID=1775926 RepID=A0ABP0ZSZ9_9ASCO
MPKSTKTRTTSRHDPVQVSQALNSNSSAKLKKKKRDIERALAKNTKLPADKRIEYERALKALDVELSNAQHNLKEKHNASKYHMVRFFERKKAIRKLKQLRRAFDDVAKTQVRKDIKKARKQLKHGEIDLMYVVLFPNSEKYISLYPSETTEDMSDPNVKRGLRKTEARRLEFRKEVERLMDQGKVGFTVDDVLSGKRVKSSYKPEREKPAREIDAPEAKADAKEEGGKGKEGEGEGEGKTGDDDDDDFFE